MESKEKQYSGLHVRLTDKERTVLKRYCIKNGYTVSEFVKSIIKGIENGKKYIEAE